MPGTGQQAGCSAPFGSVAGAGEVVVEKEVTEIELQRMRLATAEVKRDGLSAIVPTAAMKMIRKLAGDDAVNLEFGENSIVAEGAEWTLAAKLIEGNYPNYSQVIPKPSGRVVEVSRARLLKVFPLVAAVDVREHGMELREDSGSLCVKCESPEGETRSLIMGKVPAKFAAKFNSVFLQSILKSMTGDDVSLDMADETMPALFVDGDFSAVLMPLRLEVKP